jgi:hypothetical protein
VENCQERKILMALYQLMTYVNHTRPLIYIKVSFAKNFKREIKKDSEKEGVTIFVSDAGMSPTLQVSL